MSDLALPGHVADDLPTVVNMVDVSGGGTVDITPGEVRDTKPLTFGFIDPRGNLTALPAHVEARTYEYVVYTCHRCGARLRPGQYTRTEYATQLLEEWLQRHQHDPAPPTEREPQ